VKCAHPSVTEGAWPAAALAITEAGRAALAKHRAAALVSVCSYSRKGSGLAGSSRPACRRATAPAPQRFRARIMSVHPRQRRSRHERERQHEGAGRLRGTDGSNPASSSYESATSRAAGRDFGLAANALDRPVGVTPTARRLVLGDGGVPMVAAGSQMPVPQRRVSVPHRGGVLGRSVAYGCGVVEMATGPVG
jgi:hypothetical protein